MVKQKNSIETIEVTISGLAILFTGQFISNILKFSNVQNFI